MRRVGGPGLQTGGKPFEIIVGRVTPRGVFQFFHSFRETIGDSTNRNYDHPLVEVPHQDVKVILLE